MPKYPDSAMKKFTAMIRRVDMAFQDNPTHPLLPLLAVLDNHIGTADEVTQRLNKIPTGEASKFVQPLSFLKVTYDGLPTYLGQELAAVRQALCLLGKDQDLDKQVQVELDKVSVNNAKKYEKAIELVVQARPGVEYFGLESFAAVFTGNLTSTITLAQNRFEYTSKHFHATAKSYAIVPKDVTYDLGFIQICESRTQIHEYTDDQLDTRWEMNAGGFPRSDSAGNQHIPWYYVGVGAWCANPTAIRNHKPSRSETYELDDAFEKCATNFSIGYTKGGLPRKTRLRSAKRKQAFRAWFAMKRTAGNRYRLLKEIAYTFDFRIDIPPTPGGVQPPCNPQDNPQAIVQTTPAADATLPLAAVSGPTTNAGDTLRVYRNNAFMCGISQAIVVQ